MNIPIFQVDAFSNKIFSGNPAAVCVLDAWLDNTTLQNIAAENNLAETAFIIPSVSGYDLRCFSPEVEIDLCGHATLASAYVVFEYLQTDIKTISFSTMSGELIVTKASDGKLSMDFPSRQVTWGSINYKISQALGKAPTQIWESNDLLVLYDTEEDIKNLKPDMEKLLKITNFFGIIVTAKGNDVDFVSRFFAPNAGIPEDPVTGRSHCVLTPFWANKLKKNELHAIQLSKRSGEVFCENKGDRVIMCGNAALYMKGEITL
ncbi:MAG: PhzF family phenazine biosynthesis protein [Cocleimonas sp.]|jgi:PhzF family phenazine biosynthesis protein